jgi:tetratricopeptide (TPR) repeat protein
MLGPLLAALAIAFALTPLEDPDTWFHLAGGRFMWQTRGWPATNAFSFAAPDYPWIDLHWVFQLTLYAAYRVGGVNGCIALAIALVLATAGLVYATATRLAPPVVVAPLVALSLTIASPRFVPRPELVSFALLGAYLWLLERRPLGPHIYLLVPLQVLWVNSHGLFAVGLVLIGCYWLGAALAFLPLPQGWRAASGCTVDEWRRLTVVLALATAACLINPYGTEGVLFPLLLLPKVTGASIFSMRIAELLPPFMSGYAPALTWAWACLLAAAGVSFLLNAARWQLGRLLAVAAFGVLSTQTLRNMSVFAWVAVPGIAGNLGMLLEPKKAKPSRSERRRGGVPMPSGRRLRVAEGAIAVTLALLLAVVATNRFALALGLKKQLGLGVSEFVPTAALEFVRDAGVTGRPFNCMVAGGLMAWQLFPGQQVFVDGRTEAYPETLFATYFHAIDAPETWPELAARYNFDYALLEHVRVDRWPLARYLAAGHGWTLVYHDESASIFLPLDEAHRGVRERAERAFAEIETRRLRQPLPAAPGFFRRLLAIPVEEMQIQIGYGDFLRFLGKFSEAARAYQRVLVINPDDPDVRLALGAAYWYEGNRDQAVAEWREILRRDPSFERARSALAQASRDGR